MGRLRAGIPDWTNRPPLTISASREVPEPVADGETSTCTWTVSSQPGPRAASPAPRPGHLCPRRPVETAPNPPRAARAVTFIGVSRDSGQDHVRDGGPHAGCPPSDDENLNPVDCFHLVRPRRREAWRDRRRAEAPGSPPAGCASLRLGPQFSSPPTASSTTCSDDGLKPLSTVRINNQSAKRDRHPESVHTQRRSSGRNQAPSGGPGPSHGARTNPEQAAALPGRGSEVRLRGDK